MRLGTFGFIQLFPKRRNSMRTYSILFSLLISFLIIASSAWAIKPRPPLQLSLHQADVSEEVSKVTLIATANLDIRRVELRVKLSSGLFLIKGEEKWEGPLKKGEAQKMELIIQRPGHAPREVTGEGIIHLDEGGVFIQKVTITLSGEAP